MKNKLMEMTPLIWGVLEELGEDDIIDINKVKTKLKSIADTRILLAENRLESAQSILRIGDKYYRDVISRAYYSMYHSARAAVYIKMRWDVSEHKGLIKKFKKVLIKVYGNDRLAVLIDNWRIQRISCDYYPHFEPTKDLCETAVEDAETILNTCKNLVEVI